MATIYKYVCDKAPAESIDLAKNFNPSVKTPTDALRAMIEVMSSGDNTSKKKLLEGLREIHPDQELFFPLDRTEDELKGVFNIPDNLVVVDKRFMTTYPSNTPEPTKESKLSACGCSGSDSAHKATGSTDPVAATPALMVNDYQQLVKDYLFKVIVGAVLIVILYKMFIPKPSVSQ